jgi:hypothetical protein
LSSLPSFSKGHHTSNKDSIACKAADAVSITRPDSSHNGHRHVKETQSHQAGESNLNGTHYHPCPSQVDQLRLKKRQSDPSHGSSTAGESWPSMASRRLRQGRRCTHLQILVGHGLGDVSSKQQPHLERSEHVITMRWSPSPCQHFFPSRIPLPALHSKHRQ